MNRVLLSCLRFEPSQVNNWKIYLGIYIRENDESVPEEFRGIGVRIEDDVVITSDKPFVVTEACPKEIDEIEKLMASR